MIVMDFARRRRLRVNGTLTRATGSALRVEVAQVYGNCPSYIRPRSLDTAAGEPGARRTRREGRTLGATHLGLIEGADTFFLGTTHPSRGADASHRGGPAGFVRAGERGLWWPDYPGNNMFNSLGNLATDDAAALLFLDFATGARLHLSGTASLEWAGPRVQPEGDDRRVHFDLEALSTGGGPGVRETEITEPRLAGGRP